MAEIELHQLQRPYQRLRIVTQANKSRLLASLCAEGQQTPVLVIEPEGGRYLLIDGYQRVEALEKLGSDTVEAVVLDLDEASALIFSHRQQRSARRSALEEARAAAGAGRAAWTRPTRAGSSAGTQPELSSHGGSGC